MHKKYASLLVIFTFLFAACTPQQPTLPYIEPTTPQENIMKVAESFSVKHFVVNPTVNTFVGNVTYRFDEKCLYPTNGNVDEVEVMPNGKRAFAKDFRYREPDRFSSEQRNCLQVPIKISADLYDKSGQLRDNEIFFVTITS